MLLSSKQALFALNVAKLIIWAHSVGYKVTFGEAYRTPEQAELNAKKHIGISNSLHVDRLAIDLNLFIAGSYTAHSKDYAHLGLYWKTLDPLNSWGGDFDKPDGNHFSMSHNGRR